MPDLSFILTVLAAACLVPSLYKGAVQDMKEFRFSEKHFDSLWINAAFILLILAYLLMFCEGMWYTIVSWAVLSIVATLIFLFIAFRYGGGGDWRAMIYIVWIAPFFMFHTLIAIGLCGIAQAGYWVIKPDESVPRMFRKVPFAVSIFWGYVIGVIFFVLTNL
jgi:hypothetical protein